MNLKERASKLKTDLPAILLALKNPKTPLLAKLLAAVTVAYALSPIDLIPDFIPVLGYLDDLILLPAFIVATTRLIPPDIWEESRREAQDMWSDGRPKKWYYAIPIVLLWGLVVLVVIKIGTRKSR